VNLPQVSPSQLPTLTESELSDPKALERHNTAIRQLVESQGVTIQGIRTLGPTQSNAIQHGLGRKPQAWNVVGMNAGLTVSEQRPADERALYLLFSAADKVVSVRIA